MRGEFALSEAGHSIPLSDREYPGRYPNMVEFNRPWESCVQVSAGGIGISIDGRPLQSESFSACSGLIMRERGGIISTFLHINQETGINERQKEGIIHAQVAEFQARCLRGTRSYVLDKEHFANSLPGISVFFDEDITFDSGEGQWAAVFKPNEGLIYVDIIARNRLLCYEF